MLASTETRLRNTFYLASAFLACFSFTCLSHADERTNQIVAAIFEHQLGSPGEGNICLMMNRGMMAPLLNGTSPLSVGAPSDLIQSLKAKGYNVFSSDECVFSNRGQVTPRTTSGRAILIGIEPPTFEGEKAFIAYNLWSGFGSCEGKLITLSRQSGSYKFLETREKYTC